MDLRNIKRWYVMNRAMKGIECVGVDRIRGSLVALLAGVLWSGGCVTELHAYLAKYGRGMRYDRLYNELSKCVAVGLVEKVGVRYRLTISGKNLLNDLEKRCREARIDK